jgi:ABC-type Fe3+/spermidine/putrescine transport system ATPase subunit
LVSRYEPWYKTFPGVIALRDVNLSVREGEIHAICGENGAGKSTLMKVLSGVYPYGSYEGQIVFQGLERRFSRIADSEHLGIIIIHQELALVPLRSIAENIHRRPPPPSMRWRQRNGQCASALPAWAASNGGYVLVRSSSRLDSSRGRFRYSAGSVSSAMWLRAFRSWSYSECHSRSRPSSLASCLAFSRTWSAVGSVIRNGLQALTWL